MKVSDRQPGMEKFFFFIQNINKKEKIFVQICIYIYLFVQTQVYIFIRLTVVQMVEFFGFDYGHKRRSCKTVLLPRVDMRDIIIGRRPGQLHVVIAVTQQRHQSPIVFDSSSFPASLPPSPASPCLPLPSFLVSHRFDFRFPSESVRDLATMALRCGLIINQKRGLWELKMLDTDISI